MARISAFRRPTALVSSSLRRELEQTSSPKNGETWAGVFFAGFISTRRTRTPRPASCQAHSLPARPAPRTVISAMPYSSAAFFFAAVFFAAGFFAAALVPAEVFLVPAVFFSARFASAAAFSSGVFFL